MAEKLKYTELFIPFYVRRVRTLRENVGECNKAINLVLCLPSVFLKVFGMYFQKIESEVNLSAFQGCKKHWNLGNTYVDVF